MGRTGGDEMAWQTGSNGVVAVYVQGGQRPVSTYGAYWSYEAAEFRAVQLRGIAQRSSWSHEVRVEPIRRGQDQP